MYNWTSPASFVLWSTYFHVTACEFVVLPYTRPTELVRGFMSPNGVVTRMEIHG